MMWHNSPWFIYESVENLRAELLWFACAYLHIQIKPSVLSNKRRITKNLKKFINLCLDRKFSLMDNNALFEHYIFASSMEDFDSVANKHSIKHVSWYYLRKATYRCIPNQSTWDKHSSIKFGEFSRRKLKRSWWQCMLLRIRCISESWGPLTPACLTSFVHSIKMICCSGLC
jgi:hypothetical protein